ncbi:MAG TPA: hypothetical protein VHT28_11225 [Silvibacterium sp.]|nr:hypothetical protein [Silvibacterium sp.]
MQEESRDINEGATEALANAMYRYTFGIVGEGRSGSGSQSLGTGVGVFWKETYLILTAAQQWKRSHMPAKKAISMPPP